MIKGMKSNHGPQGHAKADTEIEMLMVLESVVALVLLVVVAP